MRHEVRSASIPFLLSAVGQCTHEHGLVAVSVRYLQSKKMASHNLWLKHGFALILPLLPSWPVHVSVLIACDLLRALVLTNSLRLKVEDRHRGKLLKACLPFAACRGAPRCLCASSTPLLRCQLSSASKQDPCRSSTGHRRCHLCQAPAPPLHPHQPHPSLAQYFRQSLRR